MINIDKQTFADIVTLLVPQMESSAKRRAFVRAALYDAPMLINSIDYEGDAQSFTQHLVQECAQFGQIAPGQFALITLLNHLRDQVGTDQQGQVDQIITMMTKVQTEIPFEFVGPIVDGAHIFISYTRANLPFVQQLTRDLQSRGINIWVDKIGLEAGTADWENVLREAIKQSDGVVLVASPQSRQSTFVRDELAIARAANRPLYPVWIAGEDYSDSIPMGLGSIQYVEMRGETYLRGLDELVLVLNKRTPQTAEEIQRLAQTAAAVSADFIPRNPYKGLRAFREEDRADFFGRDGLISELVEALRFDQAQPRFLAVVGASGSGKSSVVMAGLLPTLKKGAVTGSERWRYLEPIVPGAHPLESLMIALSDLFPEKSQAAIRDDLDNPNKRGLHTLVKQATRQSQLILYIDQFEEIFTLTASEDERRQFIDLLTTAVNQSDSALIVILSLRADFYDRPLEYAALSDLIDKNDHIVHPLTLADLYEVIEKPTQLQDVRLHFEDGLVTEILFAVRDEIGALPLLQFTLDQLFQRRDGLTLTQSAYESIGGVRGALTQHAEQTYHHLPSDDHRRLVQALFLRLIEPGATEQDTTRRRANWDELNLPDAGATDVLQETASIFIASRLLVSAENTLEVAHEALIREWGRLRSWLNESREDLRLQKKINADTVDWVRAGKPNAYGGFYKDILLESAQRWAARAIPSVDEADFINASGTKQAQEVEREQVRQRNLRLTRGVAVGIFVIALIGGLIGSLVAVNSIQDQRNIAETQAAIAVTNGSRAQDQAGTATHALGEAERRGTQVAQQVATSDANLRQAWDVQSLFLADLSRQELEAGRIQNAVNLAFESASHYPIIDNQESQTSLRNALANPFQEEADFYHESLVSGAVLSADETQILSWSGDRTVRVWDASGQREPVILRHEGSVYGAVWSADETRILSWSDDGTVRVWDASGQGVPLILYHESWVYGAAWSADETQILSWSADETARVWDTSGQREPVILRHEGPVKGAMWNADETRILSWSGDGTVRVWDAGGAGEPVILRHEGIIDGAAWNADGTRILSWSGDGMVRVWDAGGTGELAIMHHEAALDGAAVDQGNESRVNGAAWSADETRVLSWGEDGTVRVWDVGGLGDAVILRHERAVNGVAWSADETRILSWDQDGTVRVWDARGLGDAVILYHDGPVYGAMWSVDETQILSWSADGTVRAWGVGGTGEPAILRHEVLVRGASWSADETRILSWDQDGTVRVWDMSSTGEPVILRHKEGVYDAAWSTDETHILSLGLDGMVRVWNTSGQGEPVIMRHEGQVRGAVWNADGTRILSWSVDGSVCVCDAVGQGEPVILRHEWRVYGATWSADETHILSWSDDGTARVWDASGAGEPVILRHDGPVYGATWNADETHILSWSDDGTVRVWDASGAEEPMVLYHENAVQGAAWNADETRILSWSDGTEWVWTTSGMGEPIILRHVEIVFGAMWSADGTQILSWGADGIVWVREASGQGEPVILPHNGPVYGAVWNADETRILSWSDDGTAWIWDASGQGEPVILHHDGPVYGAAWSADETRILSWSDDGTVHISTVSMFEVIDIAQLQSAVRPLTNIQRETFFLPTYTPSPTLNLRQVSATPSITPLPTLTASPTPTP